ncbi:SidJ-related pseudokinase [Desulfoluna butyratoxydans]|nr:SidJ-related pseudokinase [Desulfoluna butyratoxydans]
MTSSAEDIERIFSASRGYNALFLAAGALENACEETPENLTEEGTRMLLACLADPRFENRRTAYFFYERLARILTDTALKLGPDHPVAQLALHGISALCGEASGPRHMAICTACRGLAPRKAALPPAGPCPDPGLRSLAEVLEEAGFPLNTTAHPAGRSLLFHHRSQTLVIKCARPGEDPAGLSAEWHWMRALAPILPAGTHVPTPVGPALMRMTGLPPEAASDTAMAFLTTPAYFTYPNEPTAPMETDQASEVLGTAAFLFGYLASRGILHTAPVPLFHNRVQTDRRDDDGIYLWQKGGRLDRWLASCRFPNFGLSGLRDFEHMETAPELSLSDTYRTMGDQVLSLLLVAGSHFRSREGKAAPSPGRTDHRSLFSQDKLTDMLAAIANGYHKGYTGREQSHFSSRNFRVLAGRMTDEMGEDHHMEEILRARDQQTMEEEAFRDFLMERGYTEEETQRVQKGAADMVLFTGPHLGRFNGKISCPELIEFTATLASITITDGFLAKARNPSP